MHVKLMCHLPLHERVVCVFVEGHSVFNCFRSGLIPGKVRNLRSTPDTRQTSVTLNWDKPDNVKAAGDVTTYDIRFKPYRRDSEDYRGMTVKAPAMSVHLTRESGLKPLTKYILEVRARNDGHEGSWSRVSEYIGTYECTILSTVILTCQVKQSNITYCMDEFCPNIIVTLLKECK